MAMNSACGRDGEATSAPCALLTASRHSRLATRASNARRATRSDMIGRAARCGFCALADLRLRMGVFTVVRGVVGGWWQPVRTARVDAGIRMDRCNAIGMAGRLCGVARGSAEERKNKKGVRVWTMTAIIFFDQFTASYYKAGLTLLDDFLEKLLSAIRD